MPVTYPRGIVEQAITHTVLEFRGNAQAGDMNTEVIIIDGI